MIPDGTVRLLKGASVVAVVGIGLFIATSIWGIYSIAFDGSAFDAILADNFLGIGESSIYTTTQRLFGGALLIVSSMSGIYAIIIVLLLFRGYLKGQVFDLASAQRIRLIGWMIFALAPLSIVCETIGRYFFTKWMQPGRINIELSLSDGDIFAVVFGLLIVIVGHVMTKANEIAEENKSFV